jgi:hypothetical protein
MTALAIKKYAELYTDDNVSLVERYNKAMKELVQTSDRWVA